MAKFFPCSLLACACISVWLFVALSSPLPTTINENERNGTYIYEKCNTFVKAKLVQQNGFQFSIFCTYIWGSDCARQLVLFLVLLPHSHLSVGVKYFGCSSTISRKKNRKVLHIFSMLFKRKPFTIEKILFFFNIKEWWNQIELELKFWSAM